LTRGLQEEQPGLRGPSLPHFLIIISARFWASLALAQKGRHFWDWTSIALGTQMKASDGVFLVFSLPARDSLGLGFNRIIYSFLGIALSGLLGI
jgi:hypothetical protein